MPPGKYGTSFFLKFPLEQLKRRILRRENVTIYSLPQELLRQILLDLYKHNKDWDTDLAFFQASKVSRRFRATALQIVRTENLDPIQHFLFTRREWMKFVARYSVTEPPGGYWVIHDVRRIPHPYVSAYEADRQTHVMIIRLIMGELTQGKLDRRLAYLILAFDISASLTSLWRLQRWQKMVGVVRKRAKALKYLDSRPFRLLRSSLLRPVSLLSTDAEANRRIIMKHLFQDGEWDLVKAMSSPPRHQMRRIYDNICEFFMRWVFVSEVWPNRRRLNRIRSLP